MATHSVEAIKDKLSEIAVSQARVETQMSELRRSFDEHVRRNDAAMELIFARLGVTEERAADNTAFRHDYKKIMGITWGAILAGVAAFFFK